jgi:aldose 1-epimerase
LAADVAWKAEAVTAQRARLSQRWEQLPAELREGYPWRYQLEADYRLGDRRLAIAFTLRNAGEQALPFGLGLHPYWQLPGGRLSLPSTSHWPQREFIPTGERQKLPTELDLRQPREIAELRGDPFNATYWGRRGPIADLEQPGSWRLRIRARPRRDWPAVVVYRPPEAGIICTEPQTCTPDAVHLGERAGLRALLPGQRWRGVVEFELR